MSVVVKNGICRGLVGEIVSSENKNIIFRTKLFGVGIDLNLKKWMLEEELTPVFDAKPKGFAVSTATQEFKYACERAAQDAEYKNNWAKINIQFVLLSVQEYNQKIYELKLETLNRITGGILKGINSTTGELLDFFRLDEELKKEFLRKHFK